MAAARYASEEAAALVHYAIALIEYTKLCQPLHLAKQKVEKLHHDILEAEHKQMEKESEVKKKILLLQLIFIVFDRFIS